MNSTVDKIANVMTAIVGVAMAFVIVSSPHTSSVIRSFGGAFSGSIKAATGRG